ncbi:hypothetical protein L7F22_024287 [Adiantum nelumboides]|nr:hypothetical protein [Adiantum nelumboides]
MAFMQRFGTRETSKKLWEKLCELRLVNVFEYGEYELQFTDLWNKWVATLAIGKRAPDFLKRDCFVAGLCSSLKDKVKARFPVTFEAAREVVRLNERKLRYHLQYPKVDQEKDGGARPPPDNVAPPHRGPVVVDQQELLNRITNQLEDLSMHLIKAPAPPEHGRGQRRPPQDYHYYNCSEEGHQILEIQKLPLLAGSLPIPCSVSTWTLLQQLLPLKENGCLMKSVHGILNDGNLHETLQLRARSISPSTRHRFCSLTPLLCERTRSRNWWGQSCYTQIVT